MLFGKYLGEGMSQKEKDTATAVSFFRIAGVSLKAIQVILATFCGLSPISLVTFFVTCLRALSCKPTDTIQAVVL